MEQRPCPHNLLKSLLSVNNHGASQEDDPIWLSRTMAFQVFAVHQAVHIAVLSCAIWDVL